MGQIKSKILATVGPACATQKVLGQMVKAGCDAFRLNFSHGSAQQHRQYIKKIRKLQERLGLPLAIVGDLRGARLRLGELPDQPRLLTRGQKVRLVAHTHRTRSDELPLQPPDVIAQLNKGDEVYLRDGFVQLRVVETQADSVLCRVVIGGELYSFQGVNLPASKLQLPTISDYDRASIRLAVKQRVDYLAFSFVRDAADIKKLRKLLEELGARVPIIAKIELRRAATHYREIVKEADAIMVARGDLGVEIPLPEVPGVQKRIIRFCNTLGKSVITATQMLESMVNLRRPTRAEVSDVANAILDGSDAVMLSEETARGAYPVDAVRMMNRIARSTERDFQPRLEWLQEKATPSVTDTISRAVWIAAQELKPAAIICLTYSGYTARMIARFRPSVPLFALSPLESTVRQLCLCWGVIPRLMEQVRPKTNEEQLIALSLKQARNHKLVGPGDRVIVTAGFPLFQPGTTNTLKILTV